MGCTQQWQSIRALRTGSGIRSSLELEEGCVSYNLPNQKDILIKAYTVVVGPLIAVQSTLSPRDMAVGIATVVFFQLFGGSLFAVVSQTIFNKQFVKALMEYGPDVDLQALLAAGTVGFHKVIKPEQTAGVVLAYNDAILDTFYLGVAITAIAFLFALGLPWISVKGKKPGIGAA